MSHGHVLEPRDYFVRELQRVGLMLERLQRGPVAGEAPLAAAIQVARAARAAADEAARAAGAELPFERAARRFELDDLVRDALVLAVAAEASVPVGELIRRLCNAPWPTIGLVLSIAAAAGTPGEPAAIVRHRAVRDGLLIVSGDGPTPAHQLRVDPDLAAVLSGAATDRGPDPADPHAFDALIGTPAQLAELRRWAALATGATGATLPLVVVGPRGVGRRRWARAACGLAGASAYAIDIRDPAELRRGRRLAVWHDAAVIARLAPGLFSGRGKADPDGLAAARDTVAALDAWPGPLALAAEPREAAALARAGLDALSIELGPLPPAQREQLWHALLPAGIDAGAVRTTARAFSMRADQIARAARRVRATDDLRPACREVAANAASELAQHVVPTRSRRDLVLTERTRGELDLAIGWARERTTILDDWGFASRLAGRGLAMLFAGKPGTGKTTAAHVVAAEIGLDLLHVDLSRVVNKYIGETEKHLARVFDDAGTGAVLFFDEADALFGRRTQVRDAHDRHANVEVGYLLQRIEQHDGVTILATNRHGDLDEAFLRRFHVAIEFPVPDAADRATLWRRMLPPGAPVADPLPIERIATDYELAGGDIQTAALGAAVLAASAGEPIGGYHLYRGIQRVLAKNGILPDARLLRIVRGEPA
jgi:hypothetical protein